MTCGHCELSVREEIAELAGVLEVRADHATGRVTVTSAAAPRPRGRRRRRRGGRLLAAMSARDAVRVLGVRRRLRRAVRGRARASAGWSARWPPSPPRRPATAWRWRRHGRHGRDVRPRGGRPRRRRRDGYTLQPGRRPARPAGSRWSRSRSSARTAHPVTAYDEQHERDLHLIVVRRDLTGFQHVHPASTRAPASGRVRRRPDPGAWRVLADFRPTGGEPLVLGADLLVPGDFAPEPLGPTGSTAQVDGYDVTLDARPSRPARRRC